MHPIQVHNSPMHLQGPLLPGVKLVGKRLVETTDCAGTGSHSQQRLGHFSDLVGARASHKHVGESFCNMGFVAAITVKNLRVELAFAVSGDVEIFESARRCC